MAYEVKVSNAAQLDIDIRAEAVQQAILNTLQEDLAKRPNEVGVALTGPLADYRSLVRGTYRIVYKVMPGEVQILRIYKKA